MELGEPAGEDRERIIEAAYQCLSEPHVGAVSVAAILAHAKCSSRAFYRHFKSKDALFLAMITQESGALAARLNRIVAEHPGTPIEQLRAWIEQMFALVFDPKLRPHMIVIDSDEVRAAKWSRP